MDDKSDSRRRTGSITQVDGPRAFSFQHADSQIELVLVHVQPDRAPNGPWRTIEFWTGNTMYGLDSNLVCIEISARNPREKVRGAQALLGSRLVGSQYRDGNHFSVSYPYPVPGMEAVFRIGNGDKTITTSKVERVMLRVRMTDLDLSDNETPDWAKITGVFER